MAVGVPQCVEQLPHELSDHRQGDALVGFEQILQFAALHELHRDEGRAVVGLAILVDGDDIRMVEPSGRLRLALEARDHLVGFAAFQLLALECLDGDPAVDDRVAPFIDDAHGTLAEFAQDVVLAQSGWKAHGVCSGSMMLASASRVLLVLRVAYLYFASISQTDFCTSRCTMPSSVMPPS